VRTTKHGFSLESIPLRKHLERAEYNPINDKWEADGIIGTDDKITHYVLLREDSVTALEYSMKDDFTHFSNFFIECASPSLILRDLRSNLSEGPIFHGRAMQALFQSIYHRLRYGASLDDKVFRMGVSLIAGKMFEPNKPHEGRTSYMFEPLAPPPASSEQEHPDSWHQLHDDLLRLTQLPPDTPEVMADRELAVYSHALLYAMMVEGALEAAGMVENVAKDRLNHVIFGTKVAFAAVKVILGSVPLAPTLYKLVEPLEEMVLKNEEEKYSMEWLKADIERFVKITCAKAAEGVDVPGIRPDSSYRVVGSNPGRREKDIMRRNLGKHFVESFTTIRRLAY